ncbi:MAG: cell shape determination protein CcmA [Bacteroidota bacterium]|nr:cell shape determination protein CcmA [Bacteroidota bacterium]
MKKNLSISKNFYWISGIVIISVLVSCKKYDSLGFTPGKGAPAISSVHTWGKTDTTARYDTVITYDASGNIIKTLHQLPSQVNPFDSVTTAGKLGNFYIIYGSNLGSTSSITFNGYSAYFNRALITDNSIIVQVPSKTPYFGAQATDSLIITTLYGKAYYKFSILPPPPTVTGYSNYNFSTGSRITLTGVGFATVTSVTLSGTSSGTANVTIVNQNDSVLVVQFPATTIARGTLGFGYTAAGSPQTATATQELVDLDNAYQIFTDDFQNAWGDGSWQSPSGKSTNQAKSGTASFMGTFTANGWKIEGFSNWWPSLPYDNSYKYFSFWVKGGTVNHTLNIETNTSALGYGQNDGNPIVVPANVWTYFKIPISSISFWSSGSTLQQVGFFLKGQGGDVDETYYFDDVILIK